MFDLLTDTAVAVRAAIAEPSTEWIGYGAGACLLASSVPQLLRNIIVPAEATRQSYLRNALIVAGNAVWVVYGLSNGAFAIVVTCGISTVLNGAILTQMILASRFNPFRRPQRGSL